MNHPGRLQHATKASFILGDVSSSGQEWDSREMTIFYFVSVYRQIFIQPRLVLLYADLGMTLNF